MKRYTSRLAAGLILIGVAAGCAEEVADPSPTPPPAGTAAPGVSTPEPGTAAPTPTTADSSAPGSDAPAPTTPASDAPGVTDPATSSPTSAPGGVDEDTQWALDYTGGTAGEASGDPYRIGYINAEDLFPENTIGINAAVAFANAELGGVGGRPIEIVPCVAPPGDDGSSCATQMVNDADIDLVLTGTFQDAHQALYDVLGGNKAVLIGNGLTLEDFTNTAGVSFVAGSPAVVPSLGYTAANLLPEKPATAAVLHESSPAATAAAELLLQPVLRAAGIEVTTVPINTTASAAEVQSAMIAAGADTADVFLPIVAVNQCINVYDSIQALGIDPTVVTTALCYGTPMTDHLAEIGVGGDVPDGWYFSGYGYSYFRPDRESGMLTYVNKIQEYGVPAPGATTLEYTGFAGPSFGNVLTAIKLINQIGVDNVDSTNLDAALRGFTGPMFIQAGPIACGQVKIVGLEIFNAMCASQAGIQQYSGGEWLSVADGLDPDPGPVNVLEIAVG